MRTFLLTPCSLILAVSVAACSSNTSESSGSSSSSSGTGTTSSHDHDASSHDHPSSSRASSSGAVSGTGSSAGSRASSAASAASSVMTCPLPEFTVCDGVPADATARTINTGDSPTALGITGLVTVGMTRAAVQTAFGTDPEAMIPGDGGGDSALPFRVFYCAKRISVTYADVPDGSGNFDGMLSANDVVHRIAVFEGFAGATDTGISLGDARTEVTGAYGTAAADLVSTQQPLLGATQDVYARQGLTFTHDGGLVTAMAVHNKYTGTASPTPVNAPLDIDSLKVGTVAAAFGTGTGFSTVKAQFGTPDTEGFAMVGSQRVGLLSYSNLGLRFVSLADANDTDVNTQKVLQVYLTPPFAGVDPSNVLGLGASKAEWDAAGYENQGPGVLGSLAITKYKVAETILGTDILVALSFATDETCTERAAVLVLNFLSQ